MSEAEEISREVAARIRHYRLSRGWSQEKLAREMEASFRTINRAENGKRLAPLTTLARIAAALGVSVRDLLGLPPSNGQLRGSDSNRQPTGLNQLLPAPETPAYSTLSLDVPINDQAA